MALLNINRDEICLRSHIYYISLLQDTLKKLTSLSENEANTEDEEGLAHSLFYLCVKVKDNS